MAIALTKRTENVQLVLQEKKLKGFISRLGLALDVSGSMHGMFTRGIVGETVRRIYAVAHELDDDHYLDCWIFDDRYHAMPQVAHLNYEDYVTDKILEDGSVNGKIWNGTQFAGVLSDMAQTYYPSLKSLTTSPIKTVLKMFGPKEPVATAIIITDGDNGDYTKAESIIKSAKDKPIFFLFVGVSAGPSYKFPKEMREQYKNVDFVRIEDISAITDIELYDQLLTTKYCDWAMSKK